MRAAPAVEHPAGAGLIPPHVESVALIIEGKDVLSALFYLGAAAGGAALRGGGAGGPLPAGGAAVRGGAAEQVGGGDAAAGGCQPQGARDAERTAQPTSPTSPTWRRPTEAAHTAVRLL